ncbi:serine hydrolase [Rhodococcus sp. IEGM 1379]|nr:serine hydrolase [Rhodococcus sp. IEGM 1379]MDI9915267.1 serine hydrolase [Rhodococcus sp. IEGM 1379]
MDSATTAALDAIVDAAVNSTGIPVAVVGIWGPDGSYVKAAGVTDTTTGAPMDTNFYHRIGSVTKT